MIIPVTFIFVGLYIYYASFGWTINIAPNIGFYSSMFCLLVGFILLSRKDRYR